MLDSTSTRVTSKSSIRSNHSMTRYFWGIWVFSTSISNSSSYLGLFIAAATCLYVLILPFGIVLRYFQTFNWNLVPLRCIFPQKPLFPCTFKGAKNSCFGTSLMRYRHASRSACSAMLCRTFCPLDLYLSAFAQLAS